MGISSIGANSLPPASGPQSRGGADAEIRALEQKLRQLNTEREKAVQRRDMDEKEKLEKQIREIEKQIERLKQQAGQKPSVPDTPAPQSPAPAPPGTGDYIDVRG